MATWTLERKRKRAQELVDYLNEITPAWREALAKLPVRQEVVLKLRCGLESEPLTLREIGERFGVKQETVRRIISMTLRRLRQKKFHESPRNYS